MTPVAWIHCSNEQICVEKTYLHPVSDLTRCTTSQQEHLIAFQVHCETFSYSNIRSINCHY